MSLLRVSVILSDDHRVQGVERVDRELLDANALVGHLVNTRELASSQVSGHSRSVDDYGVDVDRQCSPDDEVIRGDTPVSVVMSGDGCLVAPRSAVA